MKSQPLNKASPKMDAFSPSRFIKDFEKTCEAIVSLCLVSDMISHFAHITPRMAMLRKLSYRVHHSQNTRPAQYCQPSAQSSTKELFYGVPPTNQAADLNTGSTNVARRILLASLRKPAYLNQTIGSQNFWSSGANLGVANVSLHCLI